MSNMTTSGGDAPATEPIASRPHMPGYGLRKADEGTGLLPWSWARDRLVRSHDYWLATHWPDCRPHVMPVWGVWHEEALWFSTGNRSRKARNLSTDSRCTLTTVDARDPVVLNGSAERIVDRDAIASFAGAINTKYESNIEVDFYDPAVNSTFRVRPEWVFGLTEGDFTGSPTRWVFPSEPT
jgi:Pyridoxamine 5'-phosphate oxidase